MISFLMYQKFSFPTPFHTSTPGFDTLAARWMCKQRDELTYGILFITVGSWEDVASLQCTTVNWLPENPSLCSIQGPIPPRSSLFSGIWLTLRSSSEVGGCEKITGYWIYCQAFIVTTFLTTNLQLS